MPHDISIPVKLSRWYVSWTYAKAWWQLLTTIGIVALHPMCVYWTVRNVVRALWRGPLTKLVASVSTPER